MLLSVVIPVYNEEEVIPLLLERLPAALADLDADYEIVFVNDGSRDRSLPILREAAARDFRYKILSFSRNFGHQAAITAGMDFAAGDALVMMDADLQDPPELLPEMLRLYREGYDVVSAQRRSRVGETAFKKWSAEGFYWMMRRFVDPRIRSQVGDFRLLSREAVRAVRGFREQHRFLRGMIAWLGLKEAILPYDRDARAAGETKYPLWKMLRFSWTAISSFSALPLRLTTMLGVGLSALGFLYLLFALYAALIADSVVPGWTSIVAVQCIFSGAILLCLGLVGDYVARIYEESKNRPLYILNEALNVEQPPAPERAIVLRSVTATPLVPRGD